MQNPSVAAVAVLVVGVAVVTPTWRTVSAVAFTEFARGMGPVGADDVRAWGAALDDEDPEVAMRAAVLLGGAAQEAGAAADALLARLVARRGAESRYAVGVDVVAARALDRVARGDRAVADRLAALAAGEAPHPDLATRVECAIVALEAGVQERVVAFLLDVLRAETPAETGRSWERVTTLAWVKTRAAVGLSRAAGVEVAFRPDGSWAHQVAEAERLEGLLR